MAKQPVAGARSVAGVDGLRMWGPAAIILALATLPLAAHGQASNPKAAPAPNLMAAPVVAAPAGAASTAKLPPPKLVPATQKAPPNPAKVVWDFLNGEFIAALLAGVTGAGFGAWGGAEIVRRQQERKASREEVRAVNVAIAHALFILNWTIALKRQHVRGMVAKHKADRDHRAALLKKPGTQVLVFQADMETLPVVELPVQQLKATVYDRLDAPGSAYAMCATLTAVVSTLQTTMQERNEFIAEKQRGPKMTDDERAAFYFGLRRPDGVIDARYPTLLDAISHYTDATILYATVMGALLMEHGKGLAERFGKRKPKVTSMNLAAAFAEGLVPDLAEYMEMFQNMGIDASALLVKFGAPPMPQAANKPPPVAAT